MLSVRRLAIATIGICLTIPAGLCRAEQDDVVPRPVLRVVDLPAQMALHKPPYLRPEGPTDPSIGFERVDVIIESALGQSPTSFLSIGRDGSYLYKLETVDFPGGKQRLGTRIVARLPPARLAELQRLLEATQWLDAAGGEGAATHTDADRMALAVTRGGKPRTVTLEGSRPAPYAALQKFFYDLARQENLYYRLTQLPDERREALHELRDAIESALGRPGRSSPQHDFTFERYHDLFAAALDGWYSREADELQIAVELMELLQRDVHVAAIARLRNDRDLNLRTAVSRALRALAGKNAVPLLAEMIESTETARFALIGLGEPAVPTIVSMIESDVTREGLRSVSVIRAYIDHWNELSDPIDPRVVNAVLRNMQHEEVRNRGLTYHRELLKLAGASEPKDPTALETARSFLKHLRSGDEAELEKIRDNVGSIEKWRALRASFATPEAPALEKLYIGKSSAQAVTRPFKDKAGVEIRLIVYLNLLRGTDWRVGPALAMPAASDNQQRQFLKSNPDARETVP